MAGPGELTFQLRAHPTLGWLIVSLQVGRPSENRFLEMVISTLTPVSAISVATRNTLLDSGHLATVPGQGDRYLVRDVTVDGQHLPDLSVGLSRAAGRANVSGFLGLDFFRRFSHIHLHVPTLQLTLTSA